MCTTADVPSVHNSCPFKLVEAKCGKTYLNFKFTNELGIYYGKYQIDQETIPFFQAPISNCPPDCGGSVG